MVTTVSDESSKAYLQMCVCVCVFVATNICGVLERFERGFETKIQKVAFSVGKKKSFYDDTTRKPNCLFSLSLSLIRKKEALFFFAFLLLVLNLSIMSTAQYLLFASSVVSRKARILLVDGKQDQEIGERDG